MSSSRTGRITTLAAIAALALPALPALASTPKPRLPQGRTGAASHILTTSALLTGTVITRGQEVTYWFVYGRTTAYGSQTATGVVPAASTKLKVGQPVSRLAAASEYHFALVINWPGAPKPVVGPDQRFTTKSIAPTFELPKTLQATYGLPFILSGGLLGSANAGRRVVLEASPFPYLESFTPIGAPTVTNSAGRFAFRISHLTVSTQLRLITLAPLPVYSHTLTVAVVPRVVLHVRRSSSGLVRMYGTITPAVHGATVLFQLLKAVRPPSPESEVTTRYVTQFSATPKKGAGNSSRFSIVTRIRRGGRYRAFLRLKAGGPLASGASNSLVVRKS